jgi:peptide/nickel transport system substrate-binding protein
MRLGLIAVMLAALAALPAGAAELRIGMSAEPSSIDPHYHNLTPNNGVRMHVFDALTSQDARLRARPRLAESWRAVDDRTWEFALRRGVVFSDGTPFDAQDVVYTICRVSQVPNSPSSFTIYTKVIEAIEVPDPHTVRIRTSAPYPLLPVELSTIGIVSAEAAGGEGVAFDPAGCKAASWPATAAFNDLSLAIGTGPFRVRAFERGERVVLERNPTHWGPAPRFDVVTLRPITNDAARVAALLAGDVDLIENPSIQDVERLRNEPGFRVERHLSNRVIFVALGMHEKPPGVEGTDGRNPLLDRRVREALSLAIDRDAIASRLMRGMAEPASQYLPAGFPGHDPSLRLGTDPARARELLAEAGYPQGFRLVLGAPNDRYVNDAAVAQAVAQMFARIGVRTEVDASTSTVFFARRNKEEFSAYLAGWGATTGEMSSPLKALVATRSKEKGTGTSNYTRYSNPRLDAMLDRALSTLDDAERDRLLREAVRVAVEDFAVLPIHHEVTSWAMRDGLAYEARSDQYTLAHEVGTR